MSDYISTTDLARERWKLEGELDDLLSHDRRTARPDLNAEYADIQERLAAMDDLFHGLRAIFRSCEMDLDPERDDVGLSVHPDDFLQPSINYRGTTYYIYIDLPNDDPGEPMPDVMPVGADDPEPFIDLSGAPAHPDEATAYGNEPPYDPAYDEPEVAL